MKAKYSVKDKQPKQEQIQQQSSKSVRMEEAPAQRIPTARELLEASYNEIRRAKQQEKMEKIARFKTSMF